MRRFLLRRAAAIIAATISIDIITKSLAQKIPEQGIFIVSSRFFQLQLTQVENFYLSFGLKTPAIVLVSAIGLIAAAGILAYFLKNIARPSSQIFSAIVGGACANFIDRISDGAITDFISISILGFTWPTFNFADSAILIGLIFFISTTLFPKKHSHSI